MIGYAVIDTETTGLNLRGNDRIIEIAVILLDKRFRITGRYETILNPQRDLGMVSLHGIDGLIASQGYSFRDIMPSLSSLLHKRVIIGHNARYDVGMLTTEYKKEGIVLNAGIPIDTMQIAKGAPPNFINHKLVTLCGYFNIPLINAHSAMADALATTDLFIALMKTYKPRLKYSPAKFNNVQRYNDFRYWRAREEIVHTTNQSHSFDGFLSNLPDSNATIDDIPDKSVDQYLRTLHLTLLNNKFSPWEQSTMESLITKLALSKQDTIALNEEYIFMLICQNLKRNQMKWNASPIVDRINIVKEFIGVSDATTKEMLLQTIDEYHHVDPMTRKLKSYFNFTTGDAFTISGEEIIGGHEYWEAKLGQRGYTLKQSTTKATKLVIAHDPYSLSAKAVKARQYGIPILTESTVDRILKKEM